MSLGRGGSFAGGLLIGSLLGGAVALLLAPSSGEEAHDILRAKARQASNRAKDTLADFGDQARSVASEGATNVGDAYSRGAQAVEEARRAVDDAIREGRDAASEHRAFLEQRYVEQRNVP